jgi:hypothetical protein
LNDSRFEKITENIKDSFIQNKEMILEVLNFTIVHGGFFEGGIKILT